MCARKKKKEKTRKKNFKNTNINQQKELKK